MSIIHNALQKTHKAIEANQAALKVEARAVPAKKNKKMEIILLFTATTLMALTMLGFPFGPHPTAKLVLSKVHVPTPKLQLDGVFLSGSDRIAVINKKNFHLGDVVDGMKIVKIDLSGVSLRNRERSLLLTAAV